MNESWNMQSEGDCCSWEGVTSTHAHNNSTTTSILYARVTALSLSFVEFSVSSATILESLCNLPLLSTLDLISSYDDNGPSLPLKIPECLGEQLPLLQVLTLSNLNLKGPIPTSFSRLLHLQHLNLSFNYALSGPLLPLLHLPTLTSLDLSFCNFSGPLPHFHTPLLQKLTLIENDFSGPFPPFNINNPLLQSLAVSGGNLNTTLDQLINQYLSNLTGLTHLDLSENIFISGPIPSSISRLFNLQHLSLAGNSLSGALPHSLCELSHLITLDLSYNLIGESVPYNCRELINLTTLDLSSNNFTGSFPPWIGHLASLEHLDLSSNQFASAIPDEWQNLQNLQSIHLGSGNSLNGTGLPEWLFRLPKLEDLSLVSMGLQSEDVLCSTRVSMLNKTLWMLHLSGNNLTGSDLLECFALHNFNQISEVSLDDNPLSISLSHVQLPPTIWVLELAACNLTGFLNDKLVFEGSLFFLNLSHNHLVGKIPTKHTNLTATFNMILDLSNNYFTGFDSYGSLQSLWEIIDLSNNLIAGDVSTVLQTLGLNCTNYTDSEGNGRSLRLSYNEVVGRIPASLAECTANDLRLLSLDHNNLTGQIPENFEKFRNIYSIRLDNNHLKGIIPASIITKNLLLLEVSYNELEGDLKTLFSFLQSPSSLVVLGLAHNCISGSIPPFLGSFTPALRVIDLSNNHLQGNIPRDLHLPSFQKAEMMTFRYLRDNFKVLYEEIPLVIKGVERTLEYVWSNFRFLDLSENQLEGVIPSELGDLAALLQLNLSHNRLSGPIPEALGKLSMLETLDLSVNKLQGPIPPSLSNLTKLSVFNVSYNEALVGCIPPGSQMDNNESYIGDPLLCGYPFLQRACPVVDVTNASDIVNINDKVISTWILDEWVSVPGLCLGFVVGFWGVLWLLHGPRLIPWLGVYLM